jgi:hypothetical protein
MISLTREDWSEIYYALETKSLTLRQGSTAQKMNLAKTPNGLTIPRPLERRSALTQSMPDSKVSIAANDISGAVTTR